MNATPTTAETEYDPYQLLRVYSYYRLLLGALLLLIYNNNLVSSLLGSENSTLFLYTCWAYTAVNFMALIIIWRYRATPTLQQRFLAVFIDIVAITVLMYASGGANAGLGYLFLVAVAAAGMLLPAQLAIFCAALATIGLVGESLIQYFSYGIDNEALFVSGYLGVLIFLITFTFQYITRKMRHSKAQVMAQQRHVAHLQKLARLIVERMRTGIVVLNKHQDIELINNAAKELLGLSNNEELSLSVKQIPEIAAHLQNRKDATEPGTAITLSSTSGGEVKLSTANLELSADTGTLIFVEDNRALTQQAQQLKLASLGRLTASIAHEIRNPLGAISHATQLLAESTDLAPADLRLLDIINVHTKRVNQIIENIFQVSKRKLSEPQIIELNTWLENFITDYCHHKQLETGQDISASFQVKDDVKPLSIRFDESQLQQVLSNLLDNALRYIKPDSKQPPITLITGLDTLRNTPSLCIMDNGPGIAANNQKHLFEPFFTTENTGSGLGLFLCKELCEANQAYISYIADEQQPSCFTIQFAHSEKVQQ